MIRFYVNDDKTQDEVTNEEGDSLNSNTTALHDEQVVAVGLSVAALASPAEFSSDVASKFHHVSNSTFVAPKPRASIRSNLPDLIAMTRPSNIPGVTLFHMLGTYLAVGPSGSYWKILFSPSMLVTLMALQLTSATSMLVNDYYDTKLGRDSNKAFQPLLKKGTNIPSPTMMVVAKRFLSYLYAAALVCGAMVPGIPARLAVVMGLMLTFWYTQHLKVRRSIHFS